MRRWPLLFLALVLVALAAGPVLRAIITARVRGAAAARGLAASWVSLEVRPPLRVRFRGLIIARPAGKITIKLAVPRRERDWWTRLWGKILSPFPNCNAVENRPAFVG